MANGAEDFCVLICYFKVSSLVKCLLKVLAIFYWVALFSYFESFNIFWDWSPLLAM